ncbi:hypothetical protein ACH0CG_07865 [Microbacterium sp. 179-I 1D1 NHS]|uniref:hypothetical protein n=1 Tax=Microbacterium sp. 179-I 1D1 NHS TaxID=3374298 RepID=UPI00387980A3
MEEDVLGERPHSREPESGSGEIPSSVGPLRSPPFVMGSAVAFDDQPAIDDEVHPADSLDLYL